MTKEFRPVVDGERLSGHGGPEVYPEIEILDGPSGAMLCTIAGFNWADVKWTSKGTELWIEGKTCVTVSGGIVRYFDPRFIDGVKVE